MSKILVFADNHFCERVSIVNKFGLKYSVRLENQIATMNDCIKEFIGDDDQFHIEEVVGRYGGIDKEKPRVEIWID